MSAPMSATGAKRPNRAPTNLPAPRSEREARDVRSTDGSIRPLAGRPDERHRREEAKPHTEMALHAHSERAAPSVRGTNAPPRLAKRRRA
jgi:hypothetical protein